MIKGVGFTGDRICYELRKLECLKDSKEIHLGDRDSYELVLKNNIVTVVYKVTRAYITLMGIRVTTKHRNKGIATEIIKTILGINELCSDQKLRVYYPYNTKFWNKYKDRVEFVGD